MKRQRSVINTAETELWILLTTWGNHTFKCTLCLTWTRTSHIHQTQQCQEQENFPTVIEVYLSNVKRIKKLKHCKGYHSSKLVIYTKLEKKKIIDFPKSVFWEVYYFIQKLNFLTLKKIGTPTPNHVCGTGTFGCQQFIHITFQVQDQTRQFYELKNYKVKM